MGYRLKRIRWMDGIGPVVPACFTLLHTDFRCPESDFSDRFYSPGSFPF
jgi:hypothetical protein